MKTTKLILCVALALSASIPPVTRAGITVTDTIDPLPGPDASVPHYLAINHATHTAYVVGGGSGFQDCGIAVIDTTTGTVAGTIDVGTYAYGQNPAIPFTPYGLVADESSDSAGNKLYAIGRGGEQFAVRTIDPVTGATQPDVSLGTNFNSVSRFDYPLAVNPKNHKFYVVDDYGQVAVGTSSGLVTTLRTNASGAGTLPVANPTTNTIVLLGGEGTGAVIDSAADTSHDITLPPNFYPYAAAYNSTDGYIYTFAAAADQNGNAIYGIFVFDGNASLIRSNTNGFTGDPHAITVDPSSSTVYVSTPESNTSLGTIVAYDASTLTSKKTYNVGGGVLAFDSTNGGSIYFLGASINGSAASMGNRVGIVNAPTGAVIRRTVGYNPYRVTVNRKTNRVYITDQETAELLVINAVDHTVAARVSLYPTASIPFVGVSETLNRIYLEHTEQNPDLSSTLFLDVYDGSNNNLIQSVSLGTTVGGGGPVAVDDVAGRVYVLRNDSYSGRSLTVLDVNANAVTNSVPLSASALNLVVNPVTSRIYISARDSNGNGIVTILDGSSYNTIATANAGALPGPMAVNTKTNKIYVANIGAGSVDNSFTVIDGATNGSTTISNISNKGADAVTAVAVDEATNTVFVGDNGDQTTQNGYVNIFKGSDNSFQSQIQVGRYPQDLAFNSGTSELYVPNNESGTISVLGSGVAGAPPAPPHGGLSATVFRVNGSDKPSNNVADSILHFSALQSGMPNGLVVKVQTNTIADNSRTDWVDLPNGSNGYMTVDAATGQFVLSSSNYPLVNGLYFRALSTAPGYPDSPSNIVGPFNVNGGSQHLSPTTLYVATNGPGAEMNFRANVVTEQATLELFIQATTTPDDDTSWVGLNDGRSGKMYAYDGLTNYYLDSTNYPAGDPVYFRAIAKADPQGFVASVSNIIGIRNVVVGQSPTVEITPPPPQAGSQSGLDPDHPLIVTLGTFSISAQATSPDGRQIKKVTLIYDGSTVAASDSATDHLTTEYTTSVPGDHVIKATATDDRGIVGYADPVYIRIKPSGGKVFSMVASGDWSNPANWNDEGGNQGVPGVNDFAILGSFNATISQAVTAFSASLNGGSISGAGGTLNIDKFLTIASGTLKNIDLTINPSAVMALIGDEGVPMSGTVTNKGTIKITGRGGILPVPSGTIMRAERAGSSTSSRASFFDGIAAFFKNVGDFIFRRPNVPPKPFSPPANPPPIPPLRGAYVASFENSGRLLGDHGTELLNEGGGSLIGHDGGSLIGHDGGSLIGMDGASLITTDGGSVISHDGGTLIGHDGGSLISPDGASVRAMTTGDTGIAAASTSGYVQTGGETNLSGIQILSSVTLNGGTLTGSGVIAGSLTNNGGYISPGHSAGTIFVTGDFNQAAGGTFIAEDGGVIMGQSDLLQVSGTANLGGKLDVRTLSTYQADAADTFSPIGYGSATGTFASTGQDAQVSVNADGLLISVNPAAAQPRSGQPLNISTRMEVLQGDNVLIAGFIVTGPPGSTKKVMIRGLGSSLASAGLANPLLDPLLELHEPDGTVVTNDNWQDASNTGEIPNGFQPADPRESVIVADLSVGAQGYSNYTAVLRGAHGETGVGLAEAYDLSSTAGQFANISTRGYVDTGDNVMIGGFIVGGGEPAKVLVRAIGPSLTAAGVQGALQSTVLELHDANGAVISNQGWRSTQESEIIATTIPPSNDGDSAIVETLVPGNYSAVVRGVNNSTGVALVEAYNLQ